MIDQRDLNGFTEIAVSGGTPFIDVMKCFLIYGETTNIHYISPSGANLMQVFIDNATMLAQMQTYRDNFTANKGLQFVEIPDPTNNPSNYFISLRTLWYFMRTGNFGRFVSISGYSVDYDYGNGAIARQQVVFVLNTLVSRGMMIDQATQQ